MPFAPSLRRFRLTDARARLITNVVLIAAITLAIATVLSAIGQPRG